MIKEDGTEISRSFHRHVVTPDISAEDLVKERDKLEQEVRDTLNIPFNPAGGFVKFEHSMGQGQLPGSILRTNY